MPGWLGRELQLEDGLPVGPIDAAAADFALRGFTVPPTLRTLHARLGACEPLMRAFNRFLPPAAWELVDEKLLFLEECQDVCQWLVDADEQVWMRVNGELHTEALDLDDFLGVVLPYQLAQGGWPHSADMAVAVDELEVERDALLAELGWPLLARHNGLTMHGADSRILWSLDAGPDDDEVHLFVSCLHAQQLEALCERFDFVDLS